MDSKRSNKDSARSTTYQTPVTSRFLQPELSDEANIASLNTSITKHLYDKANPHHLDFRSSNEAFGKSFQASTQHSLNLKQSFFNKSEAKIKELDGPEGSLPGQSSLKSTLRTDLKHFLKELDEGEPEGPRDRRKNSKSMSDLNVIGRGRSIGFIKSSQTPFNELEADLAQDVENEALDLMIPRLRWCAFCKAEVMTEVEFVNNSKTFWSAVGIFLSGGFLGCFLLPYMSNSCKGARLICHSCGRVVN